jgi:hypothetical protein
VLKLSGSCEQTGNAIGYPGFNVLRKYPDKRNNHERRGTERFADLFSSAMKTRGPRLIEAVI